MLLSRGLLPLKLRLTVVAVMDLDLVLPTRSLLLLVRVFSATFPLL